ncbi:MULTISPECIES: hypothetical protein [Elizabethkingia]|uniref:hypothetical protein n=1 Tax=Elizabethkingia TaxID=308865 RepID=UPI000442BA70|nr:MULTISPECIES: hypothetical protein [Elizabethkingia]MCT3765523.1 hypothetical protein [Elizabethkingia anophelis]MCT4051060.1 hypothetical protein [Elizabethkingia anophelis]MCT4093960.1 hypothetical protein [Elizabethkingia anophelis]MCT4160798.1 hypothetical protein [Elizabethkingia anophelis]MCT4185570.1 hypothetical protein [Elizabethkingia anophelis]
MSFKLIAIRPLSECNSNFLKNLQPNYIYQLDQNYNFYDSNDLILNDIVSDNLIKRIEIKRNQINNLYDLKYSIPLLDCEKFVKINISAIVGKNGSGKSSLVELLYVAFYKISRICEIIDFSSTDDKQQAQKGISNIDQFVDKEDVKLLDLEISSVKNKLDKVLKLEKNRIIYDEDTDKINVEFIYSIDDHTYVLRLENGVLSLKSMTDKHTYEIDSYKEFKNNLSKLFYNLVINYSLYGLNSEESGKWIEKIFHKNDSYQTPIVLNPFRDKGNIDINSENYLVRSRLMSLLFDKKINNKELAKDKTVTRIKLSFSEKSNSDFTKLQEDFENKIFPELYRTFFKKEDSTKFVVKTGILYKKTLEYILRKITLIPERYPTFKDYYDENNLLDVEKIDGFIKQLYTDRSHITLKLRQALNFYEYQDYIDDKIINEEKTFEIKDLENKINSYEYPFPDLIDLVPPSFFKFELYFDSSEENNFSNLSSGEKQKIFSLNSIVYHLRNLISVNFNSRKEELLVYNNFNIILDEIELYYHPELQRTFIFDLLNYLNKIDYSSLKTSPNLNIIFITHSPFILSDIPAKNILFLKSNENKSTAVLENKKSFGANIHELLGDNFFLTDDDIYIGEFAKNKISDTIDWLNILKEKKINLSELEENELLTEQEALEKEELIKSIHNLSALSKQHLELIEIIDEPIIKNKLIEMYSEMFGNAVRKEYLEKEKDRIIKEIEGLS